MAGGHRKQHALNSLDDHSGGTNGTLLGTESNAVAEKAFGTSAGASLIAQRTASGDLLVPLSPSTADSAASRSYVDNKAITGTTWKELVLVSEQLLSGGSGGILQAILITISDNPIENDTFIISDGTPETFIFKNAAALPNEVTIGGSPATTMANLVSVINNDSTKWSAISTTGLDNYFAAAPTDQVVIYRTATSTADDRVYGSLTAQTDIQVVEFATGNQDYRQTSGTESDLPSSDPAAKRFGFGRVFASLDQNDTHRVAEDNTAFTWDSDDSLWQNTDTGTSVTEGDGIDVTAGKISVDVAVAATEQQYGGIVKNRTPDGTGTSAADAGHLAIQTDNADLAVNSSNQLAVKAESRLDRFQGRFSFVDNQPAVINRIPTLSDFNTNLGTAAGDIGNYAYFVGSTNSTTFLVHKVANAGVIGDYFGVELDAFS